jgi:hypothetical protein
LRAISPSVAPFKEVPAKHRHRARILRAAYPIFHCHLRIGAPVRFLTYLLLISSCPALVTKSYERQDITEQAVRYASAEGRI